MILSYFTLDNENIKQRVSLDSSDNKSKLHLEAVSIIKELIPLARISEEVPIKLLSSSPYVFFDIYVPINLLFIEIQGKQHHEYTPFFHNNKFNFVKSKRRDSLKKQWCDKNEFQYLELQYNEQKLWKNQISSKIY